MAQAVRQAGSIRRIVRFHPRIDSNQNEAKFDSDVTYDDSTILYGLLTENDKAQVGSQAILFTGDVFDPTNWKITQKSSTIGKLLQPISNIPNIYCIGLNYKKHADESNMAYPNNPVIFMKPTSTLINPNESILIPQCCDREEVDYEVELVIVIGKKCKNIKVDDALNYVLGYTIANDVSARKWQLDKSLGGGQWIRGKSFDTFSPIGPSLLVEDGNGKFDCNNLNLYCKLNGKTMQNSNTNDLIFNVQELVSFVSKGTTLYPGTIILSGTPSGVGFARNPKVFLKEGDKVIVGVEKIGELFNNVKNEPQKSML